jgi:hypothetical protein
VPVRGGEYVLGAVDVGLQALQRPFHDQPDADRGGQVEDRVRVGDQRVDQVGVQHRAGHQLGAGPDQPGRGGPGAGGEVVQQHGPVAVGEQPPGQVPPDEAGAAGDQGPHAQTTSRCGASR